MKSKRWLSTQ